MNPEDQSEKVPQLKEAAVQFMRLVRLIRPYWMPLLKGMALALMLGMLGMVSPYLTKLLVDEVYPSENVSLLHVLVAAILGLGLSNAVLGGIRAYYSMFIDTRLGSATRLMFFNHLQHLKARFFDDHQVGEVNSRFQDVGMALKAISDVFQTIFVQGVYLLLVPPVLFLLEWRLALIALISLPLILAITALSGRFLRRFWKRSSEAYADLNAFQIETLSHIRTFKSMGLEHLVFQRAHSMVDNAMRQQLMAGGLSQMLGGANGLLRAGNTALFTLFGWTLILDRQMSLGDYLAFTSYVAYLYNPLSQFISLFSQFQQSAVHLSRMFEYLDSPVEQSPALAYQPPPPIVDPVRGHYRLENVSFQYSSDRPVLVDLNVEIPAGKITALVGPSGSGKTTLLRLLSSLERPDAGVLTLDGRLLSQYSLPDLRRQIAVVWQDVSLLKGTLWENLTLGLDDPQVEKIDRIVRVCGLSELVAEMPEGYETPVSEWGASLSAGQGQRVAIARALARETPVLLFDEATANLDVQIEREVLNGVFSSLGNRTMIFVTHRIANAALADNVCVMQDGVLVGQGRHDELLTSCKLYSELHGIATETDASRLRVVKK